MNKSVLCLVIIIGVMVFGFAGCSRETNKNIPVAPVEIGETKPEKPETQANVSGKTIIAPAPDTLTVALKRVRNKNIEAVPASEVFRNRDGVRLSISTVEKGYLTIFYQGSSGSVQVLFPNAAFANGKNEIQPNKTLKIPFKGWFLFDEKKGTEKVFIVFSSEKPNKSGNAKEVLEGLEKLRETANQTDSFATPEGELVRVIELKHE